MRRVALGLLLLLASCGGNTDGSSGSGGTAGAIGGTGAGTSGIGGNTAGAAGTSGASGGGAGTAGGAGSGGNDPICAELNAEYYFTLQEAKKCVLESSVPTCVHPIDKTIFGCGYFEYVEQANTEELAHMESLKQEWVGYSCDPPYPCGVGGFWGAPATCQPGGQGGTTGVCTTK
jgi:hypothetical protein